MEDPDPARWQGLTTVVVGSQLTKFLIHTSKLREIPFFRACLDVPMKESAYGVVKLPEDDPAAFSEVVDWLYHKKFEVDLAKVCAKKCEGPPHRCRDLAITRTRTYFLAKKLIAESIQNAAIDSLRDAWSRVLPGAPTLRVIFMGGSRDDKIHELARRLLAFKICQAGSWDEWKANKPNVYTNLLQGNSELLEVALSAVISFPDKEWQNSVPKLPACYFHDHVDTAKCKE